MVVKGYQTSRKFETSIKKRRSLKKDIYFTGIFDGEGCVYIRRRRLKGGTIVLCPMLFVTMTHEPTIRNLHAHFGVGSFTIIYPKIAKRKIAYKWSVYSRNARLVAKIMVKHAITKKAGLHKVATMKVTKGKPVGLYGGEKCGRAVFTQRKVDNLRREYEAELLRRNTAGYSRISYGWLQKKADEYGSNRKTIANVIKYGYGKAPAPWTLYGKALKAGVVGSLSKV